jgi:hypothetical protein
MGWIPKRVEERLQRRGTDAEENKHIDNKEFVITSQHQVVERRKGGDRVGFLCDEE